MGRYPRRVCFVAFDAGRPTTVSVGRMQTTDRPNPVHSLCPSRFCSAGNPPQELVNKRQAELANEPVLEGAIRCAACGCVWVRDTAGKPHVLGNLHQVGRSYEWRSPYKREE